MKRRTLLTAFVRAVFATFACSNSRAQSTPATTQAKPTVGVLHGAELEKLIPPSVFFQGQSATVQLRNAGGVRFPGNAVMFAVKVDTGGYATSVQERYQDYLITETPLLIGEGSAAKTLAPGAYGVGFTEADGFLVMDIAGHTLFAVPAQSDKALRRPTPLQVLAEGTGFRLYSGRTYVTFAPASQQ